jgi:hypothetical protein
VKPDFLLALCGPTKEAAEKHHRQGTGSAVPLWTTGNEGFRFSVGNQAKKSKSLPF